MKLVRPVTITDSILISSSIAEGDAAEWSSGTTYSIGDLVISLSTHRVYESLVSSNIGNDPITDDGTKWLDRGATNRWKMFDGGYSTQSEDTTSISISLYPGRVNSVGIMNIEASSILIEYIVDGVTEYSISSALVEQNANNWYEYFYAPIERDSEFVITDLSPIASDGYLNITLSAAVGSTVKVGLIVPGFFEQIGTTLWGVNSGIEDYSLKSVDDFGNYTIVERKFSRTMSADIYIDNERTGYIYNLLSKYRATPALWIGNEDYNTTISYGFIDSFKIVLATPAGSQCSLEIEGLS